MQVSDFSRARICIASSNRTISCAAAKRDLGYRPEVTLEEGLKRLVAHFQPLRAGQDPKKDS